MINDGFCRLGLCVLMLFCMPKLSDAGTVWYNPDKSDSVILYGQAFQGQAREGYYHRLPLKYKEVVREPVWKLAKNSAGESLVFCTDAEEISVRYGLANHRDMPHMPKTGSMGIDLYTYDKDGNEVWLVGNYQFRDTVVYRFSPIMVENGPKLKHYTLYLPLYSEVEWLEVGVPEEAMFCFDPVMPGKPIVAYGTSICQGACASRPAMAWSNILQRRLGHEVVNLGFSGNAHLENEVMDILAEIDARIYILDAMPNVCCFKPKAIFEAVLRSVRRLRSNRPETPILLVDHLGYPHANSNPDAKEIQMNVLAMQRKAYEQLLAEGFTGLYYLSHDEIALPQDATVEGVHVSDYGMVAYADAYEKKLREILNEPIGVCQTTIPVVQQRGTYQWMTRHREVMKRAAGNHYSRVLIGDSIMHFWGGAEDAPIKAGTSVWNELEGTSLNMGCGGDRIENVLWRIYHGQLDNLTADRIYLTIGVNNIFAGSGNDDIVRGISMLVEIIKSRRPEADVVMVGILPCRNNEARIREINKILKSLAVRQKVMFEDPGYLLLRRKDRINEYLFLDGLHPNVDGYKLLAPYYM